MNEKQALEMVGQVVMATLGVKNPWSLAQFMEKFAFDVKLPVMVYDSTTGEETWAESMNSARFITMANEEARETWMIPRRNVESIDDIIEIWRETNYTTTERNFGSVNVGQSDTVYESENVWRCANCNKCKNIAFSDGCHFSEYVLASQRSGSCTYCIRVDDSANCTNSVNVICSGKISNSLFIQDSNSLHECMFCSHIANKRYCIANMQFEKEEYFAIKKQVIDWIVKG
ncbi:hypothetical protein IJJ39_00920 [Candidatus Saccharibacteria bacterium]|nr:hypothetical protein [Candidatus Saccharibacteria bacterium]